MSTVYVLGENLYLNITNQCTNRCTFCIRNFTDRVGDKVLWLNYEPTYDEITKELEQYLPLDRFKEIVFCGFGEPLLRINLLKKLVEFIRSKSSGVKIRVDTNGHANIFHQRNVIEELKDYIDAIYISLNAENEEKYNKICRPVFESVYNDLLEFIKLSKLYIKEVKVSIVDLPIVDKKSCEEIAKEIGVPLYVRSFVKTL
ncbi:MAG: radical SAM protein [Dictyoglomus sp. NZ13-RE01]|nr:MAG: radical SAM protein [Dictyoglomus sp. NZ13-RE01]